MIMTTKMPPQPIPRSQRGDKVLRHTVSSYIKSPSTRAAGDDRAICPATFAALACMRMKFCGSSSVASALHDARAHGERRDAGGTHHGVDLLLAEKVQKLCEHDAAHRVHDEAHEAERHDDEGIDLQEVVILHLHRDAQAQKDRDEVHELVLGALGEAVEHAAFAQ